ncbi:hypothetical protein [Burkholderia sp. L27(2015)]|uniref:hypothetical protein n=1 Tax=Burkholderia sp. L27(2015) TaxID=1641858 RepID=UPI00131E2C40|nr:hypothetical protein [Burkholderia sp. L27(2015)]
MLTQEEVLDVFDSFDDRVVHHNALQARLRAMGHDTSEVASAVTAAVQSGALTLDDMGQLRRP